MTTEATAATHGLVELEVGAVAHGGHCVARHEGRVVFVRLSLPGERVRARLTEHDADARFWRADAVEVLRAAPERTAPSCGHFVPGGCGGCDFQHVTPAGQRALKATVVAEQLSRLAGIEREIVIEPVGDPAVVGSEREGLDWRTRVGWAVDAEGRTGLRRHRSHDVVPVEDCPIAHPGLPDVASSRWPAPGVEGVDVAVSSRGERLVAARGEPGRSALPKVDAEAVVVAGEEPGVRRVAGRTYLTERVRHRDFRVTGTGFWQVHPAAPETLVAAVLELADVRPGERVADLYAGAGLLTAFLAEAAGEGADVMSVESDPGAVRDARRNLHDLPQVRIVTDRVDRALRDPEVGARDVVVLDPPRTGARAAVVRAVAGTGASRVVYVACDPAALARDLATFAEAGYRLATLRAFDLFPMTHHVECVALLLRDPVGG